MNEGIASKEPRSVIDSNLVYPSNMRLVYREAFNFTAAHLPYILGASACAGGNVKDVFILGLDCFWRDSIIISSTYIVSARL